MKAGCTTLLINADCIIIKTIPGGVLNQGCTVLLTGEKETTAAIVI